MSSVVLLRPDKAGDLVKTLPVLRALTQVAPDTKLHLLVSKANESLLKFEPKITYSVLPSNWEDLSSPELKELLDRQLSSYSFQIAINLLCDPFAKIENLLTLVPAHDKFSINSKTLHTGIWAMTFKEISPIGRDESLNIAELIGQAMGINLLKSTETAERSPHLGDDDIKEAESTLGKKSTPWLAICPFAGTQNRTHPIEKWQKFIGKVCKRSQFEKIILFGAPSDSKLLEETKKNIGNPSKLTLAFPSSFRALGAYLKRCDRVVAVDSGPLHLSLALGIPSLGFLSGGDHLRWFNKVSSKDKIVYRGILNRYPSFLEMWWYFSRWT